MRLLSKLCINLPLCDKVQAKVTRELSRSILISKSVYTLSSLETIYVWLNWLILYVLHRRLRNRLRYLVLCSPWSELWRILFQFSARKVAKYYTYYKWRHTWRKNQLITAKTHFYQRTRMIEMQNISLDVPFVVSNSQNSFVPKNLVPPPACKNTIVRQYIDI